MNATTKRERRAARVARRRQHVARSHLRVYLYRDGDPSRPRLRLRAFSNWQPGADMTVAVIGFHGVNPDSDVAGRLTDRVVSEVVGQPAVELLGVDSPRTLTSRLADEITARTAVKRVTVRHIGRRNP